MSKLLLLPLLTVHGSIAAVLLHSLDPPAGSKEASLSATFSPLSNDGGSSADNIIAASVGETIIPDEARTAGQPQPLAGQEAFLDQLIISINEGDRPQSFILSDTSSKCGKTSNGQAQPNPSNKRVRPRETGEYCQPDDGLDHSSPASTSNPQNPTTNPPHEGFTQQGAGSSIQKNPSATIPSAAKGPTANPLLCPNVERMIPVCHGMYETVLGLGPFELEHCSPSM
ncbi:hypothetical protein MMC31_007995 [Peltigera leucophlebia]|nr:hypothetical protein [Peltigera leucophlebia]